MSSRPSATMLALLDRLVGGWRCWATEEPPASKATGVSMERRDGRAVGTGKRKTLLACMRRGLLERSGEERPGVTHPGAGPEQEWVLTERGRAVQAAPMKGGVRV